MAPMPIMFYPLKPSVYPCSLLFSLLLQVLAGFGPERGRYWLAREVNEIDTSALKRRIFPGIEQARSNIAGCISLKILKTEIAGNGLLDLLEYMRSVILQDAALLTEMDGYKTHPIFQHEVRHFSFILFIKHAFILFIKHI